ncbi:MAG: AAA family ATPase [Bryobacteraceae bacterium]
MSSPLVPQPPAWRVDWESIDAEFDWIRAMKECPQDPVYHAEGNVWIHTRMVCEAMAGIPAWRALPEHDQEILFWAGMLHDVAKPACTRTENGRITSRGHATKGAVMARGILWRLGMTVEDREKVCGLVRFHQWPYYILERPEARASVIRASQTSRCDWLAILAEADVRGRICSDQARLVENVELFAEFAREQGCLASAWPFANAHSRFLYFRTWPPTRDPSYAAHDDTAFEVTLLAGLPASGKNTLAAREFGDVPVISLDDIRDETDGLGAAIDTARQRAREYLRVRQPFVWNATNLREAVRRQSIDLFAGYGARVRIVCLEAAPGELLRRNRARESTVPERVIERMVERWEMPDRTEAHAIEVRGE